MNNSYKIVIALIIVVFISLLAYQKLKRPSFPVPKSNSQQPGAEPKPLIPLDEILDGGPGKDGIPSIDHPKFISLAEANSQFQTDGPGLVVQINGEAKFYPYQILVWHEIVNDTVGNTPVLISYCPLCNSGIVFERKVKGQVVEFGVSGKLYNSDLLMYDRKTESLWSQITGRAVVGPLTGTELTQLEANAVSYKTFAEKFPSGRVLSKDTGFSRDYDRNPYGNYAQTPGTIFPVKRTDQRLQPKAKILGIEVSGKFKAYPEDVLKAKGTITDTVNGHKLELKDNGGLVSISDLTAGANLLAKPTFWFAWFAFHPNTELYK